MSKSPWFACDQKTPSPRRKLSQAGRAGSGAWGRRGGQGVKPALLLQVIVVKASGEVFVNQIYTQLPVSTGEGARPAPPPLPRVPRGRPPSSPDHDAGRLPQLGRRGCGPNPSPAPGTASRWPPIPASILSAEAEVARRRPGLEGAAWGPPDGAPALRGPPGPPGYGNVVRRRGGRARGPGWGARGHLCPRLAFSPIKTSPVFPRVLLSVSLSLHRPP